MPASGDDGPQEQRDRRAERDQRRRDEHQQQVLDHVDREERRVVALDARHQGERDGRSPPRNATVRRRGTGLRRMGRVDPPDQPSQPTRRRRRARGRRRLERPAEEQVRRASGGSAGAGPWAQRPEPASAAAARPTAATDGQRGDGSTASRPPSSHRSHDPGRAADGAAGPERARAMTSASSYAWPERPPRPTPISTWRAVLLSGFGASTEFEDLDVEHPQAAGLPARDRRLARRRRRRDRRSSVVRGPERRAIWNSFFPPDAMTRRRAPRSATCTTSSSSSPWSSSSSSRA